MTYAPLHDPLTGKFAGVLRSDGTQIPPDPLNGDWREFTEWNATAAPPVSLDDLPRPAPPTPEQLAARAVAALLTSTEPALVGLVALHRLAFTMINDGRESRGLERIQEPAIIQMAAALLVGGAAPPNSAPGELP